MSQSADPLYTQAVDFVRSRGRASISLVQVHLRIGYYRAAGLLTDMERAGVLTPINKDGTRDLVPGGHASDCAVHNEPAYPNGPCNCGYAQVNQK